MAISSSSILPRSILRMAPTLCVAAAVLTAPGGAAIAGPITFGETPLPPGGYYTTAGGTTISFPGLGVTLLDPNLFYFGQVGPDASDIYTFTAQFNALCTIGCGGPPPPANAGPNAASLEAVPSGPNMFDLEMLSMDLVGTEPGVLLRLSPTLASTGVMTTTPVGGGFFEINSFFDIFVELSDDLGDTWHASETSTHFFLDEIPAVPEPGTWLLLGTGIAVLARKISRDRKRA